MRRGVLLFLGALCQLTVSERKFGAVSVDASLRFRVFECPPSQSPSEFLSGLVQSGLSAAAWGHFDDLINTTGWSTLEIHTNASEPDQAQAYGAGVLESSLTLKRTEQFLENVVGNDLGWDKELVKFIEDNSQWVKDQVAANPQSDYWKLVGLSYQQLQGMYDGYVHAAEAAGHKAVAWNNYYTMTLEGDLDDLCSIYKCSDQLLRRTKGGHCSVLIKVTSDDVFMGHTTWSSFETMMRIYKMIDLQFSTVALAAKQVAFSSYPGTIVSVDDWYQTNAGLVVTETTIDNNNKSLYDLVVPQTVLYWARNMVANRLSSSGAQWASTFLEHNSGTYNNEWMVVDVKKISATSTSTSTSTPTSSSVSIQSGFLTVCEQFPGPWVHTEDMTTYVQNSSYWMSFNVPFFEDLFNVSGQWELVKKYGDLFSWANTSRAQLFRKLQAGVVDEDSFAKAMRHNDFEHDDVGTQGCKNGGRSASNAISERGDLTKKSADCIDGPDDEVGTDCKITSWKRMQTSFLRSRAQSGPTYDTQPVFVWSTSPDFIQSISHKGMPDRWDFPWTEFAW